MPSPTYNHIYVCSIVYICKYCVCLHGLYGLLDFEIKLYLSIYTDNSTSFKLYTLDHTITNT